MRLSILLIYLLAGTVIICSMTIGASTAAAYPVEAVKYSHTSTEKMTLY